MLLNNEETEARLLSSNNLVNRMRALSKPSKDINLFIPNEQHEPSSGIVSLPAEVKEVLPELESAIKDSLITSTAKKILGDSLAELSIRLPEVESTKELARIATDMSRIVDNMSEEKKGGNNIQMIVYRPVINQDSHYQEIHVNE